MRIFLAVTVALAACALVAGAPHKPRAPSHPRHPKRQDTSYSPIMAYHEEPLRPPRPLYEAQKVRHRAHPLTSEIDSSEDGNWECSLREVDRMLVALCLPDRTSRTSTLPACTIRK